LLPPSLTWLTGAVGRLRHLATEQAESASQRRFGDTHEDPRIRDTAAYSSVLAAVLSET